MTVYFVRRSGWWWGSWVAPLGCGPGLLPPRFLCVLSGRAVSSLFGGLVSLALLRPRSFPFRSVSGGSLGGRCVKAVGFGVSCLSLFLSLRRFAWRKFQFVLLWPFISVMSTFSVLKLNSVRCRASHFPFEFQPVWF